jgi:hypothetical protein
MTRRVAGAVAAAGMLMLLGPTAAMADLGRTDVILPGSESAVDYHAEAAPAKPADGGATIIGGNIQIASDRGAKDGVAGDCDPDPRFGTHPRPDDEGCPWDEPVGSGQDFIAFGRHIAQQEVSPVGSGDTGSGGDGGMGDSSGDTDTSPDGAYVAVTTPTRESFNGRGGLDKDGNVFLEDRPVLEDEDQGFRITGAKIFNYLAPQGNADNRWRRLCGEGYVSPLANSASNIGPFEDGDTVPFVVQIWDADWKDPSDLDGGNQDYFIVDVFPQGTSFDVKTCRAMTPDHPVEYPAPPAAPNPPAAPARQPVAAVAPAPAAAGAVKGVTVRRGTARLAAVGTCPITALVPLRVQGRQIRSVTYSVDGRRIATVTRADSIGRWTARVDPRRLRTGVHRVRARVQFRTGAGPARTLTMSFRTCARPAAQVQPQFTG